jgi:hypothetical protein
MQANRLVALSAILPAAIVQASWAAEDKPTSSPCALVSQIDHFQYLDDRTALLEVSPNKTYRVTFFNPCRELKWAIFARIEARPGICLAKGDKIVVRRDHGIEERCIVDTIEAMPAKVPASTPSN